MIETSKCILTTILYLDIPMSTRDDVNALSILFVFQDASVVFGSENEEEILALTLKDEEERNTH